MREKGSVREKRATWVCCVCVTSRERARYARMDANGRAVRWTRVTRRRRRRAWRTRRRRRRSSSVRPRTWARTRRSCATTVVIPPTFSSFESGSGSAVQPAVRPSRRNARARRRRRPRGRRVTRRFHATRPTRRESYRATEFQRVYAPDRSVKRRASSIGPFIFSLSLSRARGFPRRSRRRRSARTFKFANTITFFPAISSADMYGTSPLKIVLGPSGSPRSISSMYCARERIPPPRADKASPSVIIHSCIHTVPFVPFVLLARRRLRIHLARVSVAFSYQLIRLLVSLGADDQSHAKVDALVERCELCGFPVRRRRRRAASRGLETRSRRVYRRRAVDRARGERGRGDAHGQCARECDEIMHLFIIDVTPARASTWDA